MPALRPVPNISIPEQSANELYQKSPAEYYRQYSTPAPGDSVLDQLHHGHDLHPHSILERDLLKNGAYLKWLRQIGYKINDPTKRLQAFKGTYNTAQQMALPAAAGAIAGLGSIAKGAYGITQHLRGKPIDAKTIKGLDNDIANVTALGRAIEKIPSTTTASNIAMRAAPTLINAPLGMTSAALLAGGETSADNQAKLQQEGYSPEVAKTESVAPAMAAGWTSLAVSALPVARLLPSGATTLAKKIGQGVKDIAETPVTDLAQNKIASMPASPWAAKPSLPKAKPLTPSITASR